MITNPDRRHGTKNQTHGANDLREPMRLNWGVSSWNPSMVSAATHECNTFRNASARPDDLLYHATTAPLCARHVHFLR